MYKMEGKVTDWEKGGGGFHPTINNVNQLTTNYGTSLGNNFAPNRTIEIIS